jgi:hypothetical protein
VSGACSTHGGEYECIYVFVGKARRQETTRRPRGRWDIIKMELRQDGVLRTELIWLNRGAGGGPLRTQKLTYGFHKILGNS